MRCVAGRHECAIAGTAGKEIMKNIASNQKTLTVSILSLSLLTVMAGAAVAPALGVIKEHFADSDQLFVQMIISMPALYLAQFVSPVALSLMRDITASEAVRRPYYTAVAVSAVLILWSGVKQRR